ncbi:Uncharacterized protein PAKB6_1883 [Pseudomonas aeruginosa]|nr:Uncharacterized protein PAKB6_1883 [Pseudomonas aeruginosa]
MSEFGEQLQLNEQGEAVCSHSGARYVLNGKILSKVDV